MSSRPERKLRYAMVGGGRDAFIGAVHRRAMALDGQMELVAGALSSHPDKALASGRDLGLAPARNHGRWEELLADELKRPAEERIDFVSIVTPNHVHFPVAKAFAAAGIHVVCDKPLVHTLLQAEELVRTVEKTGVVFGVTYNYTGYPMVREARELVKRGVLGELRKVVVEYNQGWLATHVEGQGNKQAGWRTDPERSGAAGAIGDIGSHAENLAATVTGLELEAVCADLGSLVPGRRLDDDGSLLLRWRGGVRGVLMASQIAAGVENDLRLRVFGSEGSLDWRQENPNELVHATLDGPKRILTRGSPWLSESSRRACRVPTGHPEAFIEAFANVYLGVAADIRARLAGEEADPVAADYPRLADGVRGVRFIEKTVASAASTLKWTPMA
ncbi:Gfo/Idh/MocA family oxidoreductase [Stigmatella sp. ncwal1]|uniref:Gfo/Idh/MocA family oxidoreductase n=1 Tax=Stigmatella ashevillensis TaxID=2995309 RepID=A0ABT5DGZ8_9BACT|nr:Gfo/Idh/MocA family oxidoreductase [Stigmatella ashevillena]MDC0712038.1 Gfo/Idh/MocA family oxidoreductase [Stigmatella ashevillena]